MPDCQSSMLTYEVEQHMFAATQHLAKALEATKNLSDDFRRALAELHSHLSAVTIATGSKGDRFGEIEDRLKSAEKKVFFWESSLSLIWDSDPLEASEYLQAVNEILTVLESLKGLSWDETGRVRELTNRAQSAQQNAMERLEKELYHILYQQKQQPELLNSSFSSRKADLVYDQSCVSSEDEIVEETSESIEYTAHLIDPRVIPCVKSIANAMFACNYEKEFCEVFIGIRQEALEEYLSVLKVQTLCIEDTLKLEFNSWNSVVQRWMWTTKIVIRCYLADEKRICEQILADFGPKSSSCFVDITKGPIIRLIDYGNSLAMGPHKPENLIRLLDMYEALSDLHTHMNGLFSEESGSFVRNEFNELLKRSGDSAKVTFLKFEDAIASNACVHPFPGGGVHPLTSYVMNYLSTLAVYSDSLNSLLIDHQQEDPEAVGETVDGQDISSSGSCPLDCHFRSIAATLESTLASKSKLYKDGSLRCIFLLNNAHYMVGKVKDSELRLFFGDEWIRKHKGKFQQHATSYVSTTWSSVVSLLRDDGKTSVKERCKRFSNAFDDVYKVQTQWCIPNRALREDLQISISRCLIPAYRAFFGNSKNLVCEKYVKYTEEDLEKLLLDLFVESTRSRCNSRRR